MLQSLAVVFHSVVNGFLWYKANQLKCIFQLGNCFWLRLQLCDNTGLGT